MHIYMYIDICLYVYIYIYIKINFHLGKNKRINMESHISKLWFLKIEKIDNSHVYIMEKIYIIINSNTQFICINFFCVLSKKLSCQHYYFFIYQQPLFQLDINIKTYNIPLKLERVLYLIRSLGCRLSFF